VKDSNQLKTSLNVPKRAPVGTNHEIMKLTKELLEGDSEFVE